MLFDWHSKKKKQGYFGSYLWGNFLSFSHASITNFLLRQVQLPLSFLHAYEGVLFRFYLSESSFKHAPRFAFLRSAGVFCCPGSCFLEKRGKYFEQVVLWLKSWRGYFFERRVFKKLTGKQTELRSGLISGKSFNQSAQLYFLGSLSAAKRKSARGENGLKKRSSLLLHMQ